jgi:hypothetical protein
METSETKETKKHTASQLLAALSELETMIKKTGVEVDGLVQPVRQTVLRRYPVLFTLLGTLGVAATVLGLEKILLQVRILDEQPWLLFFVGVGILTIIGELYKKLG